jgi:hypothetical protein
VARAEPAPVPALRPDPPELEWPIDLAIAVVWIVYAVNFFGTVARRRARQLYVAVWFWIATILTIGMLHVVNSMALPVSWLKSYSLYAGVHDANIQWWYGHNAVGFLLTTPILGLMYYFLPKQAGRPRAARRRHHPGDRAARGITGRIRVRDRPRPGLRPAIANRHQRVSDDAAAWS